MILAGALGDMYGGGVKIGGGGGGGIGSNFSLIVSFSVIKANKFF